MNSDTTTSRFKKADVCAELGISPRTLENLIKARRFPPGVRVGRWSYWSSIVIDRFRSREFALQEAWRPV